MNPSPQKTTNKKYFLGKLNLIINDILSFICSEDSFFNKNTLTISDLNQHFSSFLLKFFNKDSVFIINFERINKKWSFSLCFPLLFYILKAKYNEIINIHSFYFGDVYEFSYEKGYFFHSNDFSYIEKYKNGLLVLTKSTMRVVFDDNFIISHFEISSIHHEYNNIYDNQIINDVGITPQFARVLIIAEAMSRKIQKKD